MTIPATPTSFGSDPQASRPTSAEERERILSEIEAALPALFALQKGERRIRTVGFFVSQYWNDEADDAVHGEFRYAFDVVDRPDALVRPDFYGDDEEVDDDTFAFDQKFDAACPRFDSNEEMIIAFASYACESNQDDREYVGYCLWHPRDDGSFSRTIVGTMLRPQWEDAVPQLQQPAPTPDPASAWQKKALLAAAPILLYLLFRLFGD